MTVTKRGCKNSCRSEFGSFFFCFQSGAIYLSVNTNLWRSSCYTCAKCPKRDKNNVCQCVYMYVCIYLCVWVCVSGCMNVSACLSILTKKYMMQTKCAKSRKIKIHKTNKNPVRTVFTGDNKASINVVITLIVRFYAWGTFINPLLILLDPPFPLPMY